MKTLTLISALLLTLVIPQQAFAWGDREQGILIGVISGAVLNEWRNRQQAPMTYPSGAQGEFPEFRCHGSEVECAYERGVWERKREEWKEQKENAYLCGRYGRNCN